MNYEIEALRLVERAGIDPASPAAAHLAALLAERAWEWSERLASEGGSADPVESLAFAARSLAADIRAVATITDELGAAEALADRLADTSAPIATPPPRAARRRRWGEGANPRHAPSCRAIGWLRSITPAKAAGF